MSLLTKMKYSFISRAMDKETFTVVSFKGFEAISKPYEFEILLVSENKDIDPLLVLQNPAIFTIHRDEEDNVDFNGILIQFEESQEFNGYLFFKAVLAPKLWWLSLTHHNQVFLDLTIPEIMEDALKDGGLKQTYDFDFSLNLKNIYKKLEYICQYDESHFDFVSRWAEREGLYYFFEQTPSGEKVVFTDTKMEHKDLLLGKDLIYDSQSGLASLHTKEVIHTFICKHNLLPQRVYLKDYNYLKPSQAMEGIADVDENGRGENYIYGVHFDSVIEGNRLARIRAEALLCRKSIFQGESSVPFMVPGYTFDLNEHYKDVYNRKYLVTDVTHEGHQTGYLISGISGAVEARDEEMFYSNTFTAIYSDEQFRPEHLSKKPKISGTINAKIDASASGEHAEIDELGRYKVILPFDRSGRFGGKASAWFRMMQPSAGQNQGMHFPLHKGTEVLLTFIAGNPDRPIIAGAVPNPETQSPVTSGNQTQSIIATGKSKVDSSVGAAERKFGAVAGEQKLTEETATDNYIEFEDDSVNKRIRLHSDGDLWLEAQNRYGEYTVGKNTKKDKLPENLKYLWENFFTTPAVAAVVADTTVTPPVAAVTAVAAIPPKFIPTNLKHYSYGTSATGSYGAVASGSTAPTTPVITSIETLARTAKVKLVKGDTINVQEGNVYDFGGYWVYNLGNAYIENHMAQKTPDTSLMPVTTPEEIAAKNKKERIAKLNEDMDFDLLKVGGPNWNARAAHGDNWKTILSAEADCQGGSSMQLWDTTVTDDNDNTKWHKRHAGSGGDDAEGWKNIWVEKKFGDSYEYREGNTVSVEKGRSQTIIFDGRSVVEKYNGKGTAKKSFSKSGGGRSEEKKWNHKTGNLVSYTLTEVSPDKGKDVSTTVDKYERSSTGHKVSHTWTKDEGGKGKHTVAQKFDYRTGAQASYSAQFDDGTDLEKFGISYQHKNIADFSFGDQQSFYLKGSPINMALNVNLGLAASMDINLTGALKIPLTPVGVDITLAALFGGKLSIETVLSWWLDIKLGNSLGLELDARWGGKLKSCVWTGEQTFEGMGVKVTKKPAIVAKSTSIEAYVKDFFQIKI
ncbi:MAG: type VI secretion system tip protein TssI/VgrG [Desulfobacula sp.]|jgi:type VI secretion system VgrG family protein|nr:type VI secretion system tip protein TssI/VgrG [Desulfobacula sp.]